MKTAGTPSGPGTIGFATAMALTFLALGNACTHDESLGMYCSTGACSGTDASTNDTLGCGKIGSPTGTLANQTITVAGQQRSYLLQVPSGYKATTPAMLIFAWHGSETDAAQARTMFRLETKAGNDAIFVYPSVKAGTEAWDLSADGADVQLYEALLANISANYCIDSKRVFSTGHGGGAYLTNTLGCYHGEKLRAIAPVAGGPPPDLATRPCATPKAAAIVINGRNDSVVPIAMGTAARDYLTLSNSCSTQTAPFSTGSPCLAYQGCVADRPVVWCPHDEAHAWPNLTTDCTSGDCLDAGPTIWTFFSSFH